MANLSRDEMRLYQRARRARIKAEAECYPDGGTGAQVRAAGDRAAALVMAQASLRLPAPDPPLSRWRAGRAQTTREPSRPGLREMMTASPPPALRSMFAVGGTAGKGLVAQGRGMPLPPDQAAVSAYTHAKQFEANATASINLLAREVATLKQRVGELEHERTEAVRHEPEPAWQKVLMAAAMGVQAYVAMCQAAEQDRVAAQRARRREAAE